MLDSAACWLVKTVGDFFCRLPPIWAIRFGSGLGRLICRFRGKRVHVGVLNLLAAYDGTMTALEAQKIARQSFRQLIAGVFELLRLPVMDAAYGERYLHVDDMRPLEKAWETGRPVILLTGHYGNWELSSIKSALIGKPMVELARSQKNFPKLYALLVSYRESKGNRVVHKGSGLKHLIRALDNGEMVGIVGDQASRSGQLVNFFGRRAYFATGPFSLAYDKNALIMPAFIRREKGPYHRIYFEPLIDPRQEENRDEAVLQGVKQFAAGLEKQIKAAPAQWLWMHKRWKHTPSRRVLVLTDGKMGHQKQSEVVGRAIEEQSDQVLRRTVSVAYRSRFRRTLVTAVSTWWPKQSIPRLLQWALTLDSAQAVTSAYADIIISAGSQCTPINALWSRFNHAKAITLMNPAPVPRRCFDLIIAPAHDRLPQAPNIVAIQGALARITDQELHQAAEDLKAHPGYRNADSSQPARSQLAVFLGGDTDDYVFTIAFAKDLLEQLLLVCEKQGADLLLTTSRRTPKHVTDFLERQLAQSDRCRFFLNASRGRLEGTFMGMLGTADVCVVTAESISMITETCSSGKPVVVVPPPLKQSGHTLSMRHQTFLQNLQEGGFILMSPLSELAFNTERTLTNKKTIRPLDNFTVVRDSIQKVI